MKQLFNWQRKMSYGVVCSVFTLLLKGQFAQIKKEYPLSARLGDSRGKGELFFFFPSFFKMEVRHPDKLSLCVTVRYTGLRLLHVLEAVQPSEGLPAGRPDGQRAATAAAACHGGWGLWRPQPVRVRQWQQQPAQLQPQHHRQQLNPFWTTGGAREPRRPGGHTGRWGSAGVCVCVC